MSKSLLIVESPAKAKTIGKYLGPDFEVRASVGHVIDLPPKKLGVDLKNGFAPEYEIIDGKQKIISELKKAAKGKETIYLGPDPDREGEAIAWHIAQALGSGHNFKRVLLHELTPKAIREAIANPVTISRPRFESQQTRRILDRLMGYLISPLLWDKLKRRLGGCSPWPCGSSWSGSGPSSPSRLWNTGLWRRSSWPKAAPFPPRSTR